MRLRFSLLSELLICLGESVCEFLLGSLGSRSMTSGMDCSCVRCILLRVSCSNTVDDEEEMLYGDSSPLFSPTQEEPTGNTGTACPGLEGATHKAEPTHWCMVVRENGVMEVRP